jgi:sec-independent protein translocase protein TatB
MMPGVGFAEMVLLVLVAIVVVGPKDLPLMMRKFGRFTGKMRAMAFEFKQGIDELGRQAELEELRKEVADLKKHTGLEEIEKDFNEDANKLQADVNKAMAPLPAPTPAHPAAGANGAAAATPEAAPYAGLSADHPGYDAGDDFRIDGPAPAAAAPAPEPGPDDVLTGPLPHEVAHSEADTPAHGETPEPVKQGSAA